MNFGLKTFKESEKILYADKIKFEKKTYIAASQNNYLNLYDLDYNLVKRFYFGKKILFLADLIIKNKQAIMIITSDNNYSIIFSQQIYTDERIIGKITEASIYDRFSKVRFYLKSNKFVICFFYNNLISVFLKKTDKIFVKLDLKMFLGLEIINMVLVEKYLYVLSEEKDKSLYFFTYIINVMDCAIVLISKKFVKRSFSIFGENILFTKNIFAITTPNSENNMHIYLKNFEPKFISSEKEILIVTTNNEILRMGEDKKIFYLKNEDEAKIKRIFHVKNGEYFALCENNSFIFEITGEGVCVSKNEEFDLEKILKSKNIKKLFVFENIFEPKKFLNSTVESKKIEYIETEKDYFKATDKIHIKIKDKLKTEKNIKSFWIDDDDSMRVVSFPGKSEIVSKDVKKKLEHEILEFAKINNKYIIVTEAKVYESSIDDPLKLNPILFKDLNGDLLGISDIFLAKIFKNKVFLIARISDKHFIVSICLENLYFTIKKELKEDIYNLNPYESSFLTYLNIENKIKTSYILILETFEEKKYIILDENLNKISENKELDIKSLNRATKSFYIDNKTICTKKLCIKSYYKGILSFDSGTIFYGKKTFFVNKKFSKILEINYENITCMQLREDVLYFSVKNKIYRTDIPRFKSKLKIERSKDFISEKIRDNIIIKEDYLTFNSRNKIKRINGTFDFAIEVKRKILAVQNEKSNTKVIIYNRKKENIYSSVVGFEIKDIKKTDNYIIMVGGSMISVLVVLKKVFISVQSTFIPLKPEKIIIAPKIVDKKRKIYIIDKFSGFRVFDLNLEKGFLENEFVSDFRVKINDINFLNDKTFLVDFLGNIIEFRKNLKSVDNTEFINQHRYKEPINCLLQGKIGFTKTKNLLFVSKSGSIGKFFEIKQKHLEILKRFESFAIKYYFFDYYEDTRLESNYLKRPKSKSKHKSTFINFDLFSSEIIKFFCHETKIPYKDVKKIVNYYNEI